MTFQTFVKDQSGKPVPNAVVSANVMETGAVFSRFTDGDGYADVAMISNARLGDDVMFCVDATGYALAPQYLKVTDENQRIEVTLVPFA